MEIKDGDGTLSPTAEAPSTAILSKQKLTGPVKKKRRRGKAKRKVLKPFMKMPWSDRKRNDKSKRNRFRKLVLTKTHAPAPFNNNQFLMEIHKPEQDNDFEMVQTPSARTRDSSFSVDSEENYFYSLPEDEEDFLTKEFSSVYEDAQCERLANMSKSDLIQEYLLLEAKYDTLVKRAERSKIKQTMDDKDTTVTDKDTSTTDRDSIVTERDTSGTSAQLSASEELSIPEYLQRLKEQEDQINRLKLENDKLVVENEHLRKAQCSSSEDSESDSSSTSVSCSSSSRASPVPDTAAADATLQELNDERENGPNGHSEIENFETDKLVLNGYTQNGGSDIDEQ